MDENASTVTLLNSAPLLDMSGNPVHAHGGHMLYTDGYYYWFGENRMDRRRVSCYRSVDLVNWEWRNDVLTLDSPVQPIYHRTTLELEPLDREGRPTGAVIERPKVLYNKLTGRFVMWMHWENGRDYSDARCAIADCGTVDGDYVYRGSFNPIGNMSRDCILFQDDDGTAYFISAARENADLIMYRLSPDYLSIEEQVKTLWPGQAREAPALMKRQGVYFLISSACTGWLPNQGTYAWSEELFGRWSPLLPLGDITTYDSQPAFIVPIVGTDNDQCSYLYVGDRWDPADYYASSYVFLPLGFPSDREMKLDWAERTVIDLRKGIVAVECGSGSGLFRLKSLGMGLYLAAGNQSIEHEETLNVEVRTLSYEDQQQRWTVEYGEKGRARIRNSEKALSIGPLNSLLLEPIRDNEDQFIWLLTETEAGSLTIGSNDGRVLTVAGEQRGGWGCVFLESKRCHDPRLGADPQLFQLISVR
jgi:hypothetical protein